MGSKFKNPNKYLKKEEGKDDDDEDYEKEDAVKIPQEDKFFKRQTWDWGPLYIFSDLFLV